MTCICKIVVSFCSRVSTQPAEASCTRSALCPAQEVWEQLAAFPLPTAGEG